MFRCGATRSVLRDLPRTQPSACRRAPLNATAPQRYINARSVSLKHGRLLGLTPFKPANVALVRFATTSGTPPWERPDLKHEKDIAERKLRPHPERVSATSGMPHEGVLSERNPEENDDEPWGGTMRSEWKVIKEVMSLKDVPRDALYLGFAGVLPYMATSLSTVYLAWDLNHAKTHGVGVFLDAEMANLALNIIEPIQIGYGAVIISFLGAIHWGFEWAGFRGHYPRRRYLVGVVAPAVAWPTLLLPVEQALIAQFLAFNWLYWMDADGTQKGILPEWYGMYRFFLTFVVGASLVLSLIGRGQVAEYTAPPGRPLDVMTQYKSRRKELMEQEEREIQERHAREAEEEEAEEEGQEEQVDEETSDE